MEEFTSVLLVVKECYVYQIPPLLKSEGHRASDWNVDNFLWKGRLRLATKGDKLTIRLEEPETGELFAACPYNESDNSVEAVIDSSRYFVIRVVDPISGKHAYLGMGFSDRSEAFDFNVAIQDFTRQNKQSEEGSSSEAVAAAPLVDYSLKEGQTISLNLSGKLGKPKTRSDKPALESSVPFTLPPPPGAAHSKPMNQEFGNFEDASFGDFTADSQDPNSGWAKFE
ncbi:hypothetical protein DSO57_1010718 [Entomophthora muscae]|uniref:Uncharacterized protein n=1 Tax=Entomophthora muscae TaxID=34485 RepID=A0ACC2U4P8_9FUNG|nr:hypothetical protein DSO57_1010718 [Entomophthora muscae]